jgi:hypothetical protein
MYLEGTMVGVASSLGVVRHRDSSKIASEWSPWPNAGCLCARQAAAKADPHLSIGIERKLGWLAAWTI